VRLLRNSLLVIGGWVVFFLFIQGVVTGVARQTDNKVAPLPDTRGMGLDYARNVVLKDKEFTEVRAHDASGRGRTLRSTKDWIVCQQYTPVDGVLKPVSGRARHNTVIDLGVVLLDERCGTDLTINRKLGDPLDYPMPNFRGVTPADVVRAMRSEASLRFFSVQGERISSREYSRWRVCSQQLSEGATFFGQPVAFTAVRFDIDSNANPPVMNNLDQSCPDRGWQGVRGFPPERFPALVNPA
jgi:hypothetical protein